MQETKDKTEQLKDAWQTAKELLFRERFIPKYTEWLDSHVFTESEKDTLRKTNRYTENQINRTKHSKQMFADLVYAHRNTVGKWLSNENFSYPDKYLDDICRVLGVDKEYFSFDFHHYTDKQYHDKQSQDLRSYSDQIGLKHEFLMFYKSFPELQNCFPIHSYTPNPPNVEDIPELSDFQITDNAGHIVYLGKKDLDLLKKFQDEVKDYLLIWLLHQAKKELYSSTIEHSIKTIAKGLKVSEEDVREKISPNDKDSFEVYEQARREIDFSKPLPYIYKAERVVYKAAQKLREEKGLSWHTNKDDIDFMFDSATSSSEDIHNLNKLFSGESDEELKELYKEAETDNEIEKQEYINTLKQKGVIIDDG